MRLVASSLLADEVELGRVGDTHDCHDASLYWVAHNQICRIRDTTSHVERDHKYAVSLNLLDGPCDFTTHDRAG